MTTPKIVEIAIENMLLDLENSRYDPLDDQNEIIREMLGDQGDKLINLARDIVEAGLNPSELPIVMPLKDNSNKYVVLEGNRRLAAIKLLLNPTLAENAQDATVAEQFRQMSPLFSGDRAAILNCYVVEQREDADHWIQLRHTGENEGVGIVGWEPEAVTRFNKRLGRSDFNSLAIQVMDFLRQTPVLDDSMKANLGQVPLTNLARLVNDPDVRATLGLEVSDGELQTDLPQGEVLKGLTKVVDDLSSGRINVNDIYYKADRQVYLTTFGEQDVPDPHTATGNKQQLATAAAPTTESPQIITKKKRSIPPSASRKTLIPTGTRLRIRHHRLNQIYHEMRKLEVDKFPNCAAVMLRVFLELSVDEYASSKTIPGYSAKGYLYNKLKAIANYMEAQSILAANQLKAVRVASTTPDTLFSTNTLNSYVHNKDFAPKPSELKTIWDNMKGFIEKLWE